MRFNLFLYAVVLLFLPTVGLAGQKPHGPDGADEVRFSYKFDGPRFHLRVIEIDVAANGVGELRFVRGESDEVLDCKLKLLPATIARIRNLFDLSDFLGSKIEYQDKTDMSHLGWVTVGARQGERERKVSITR